MGQTKFKILCYVYDAVLMSESEDKLQQMLFEFNQTANKYNMSISIPRDRQKSNEIRERCDGMPDVVRWSRGRRREWRENVDRMGNDRLVKAAYKEKPNTTRPLGRPPKRWANSSTSSS